MTILYVAIGGAIGSALRYLTNLAALRLLGAGFPWGTVTVNVAGSLVMGLLTALLFGRYEGGSRFAPLLMTGLLGGFTTFSAFSLDAATLFERGRMAEALLYIVGSVVLSILALFAGMLLARWLA